MKHNYDDFAKKFLSGDFGEKPIVLLGKVGSGVTVILNEIEKQNTPFSGGQKQKVFMPNHETVFTHRFDKISRKKEKELYVVQDLDEWNEIENSYPIKDVKLFKVTKEGRFIKEINLL